MVFQKFECWSCGKVEYKNFEIKDLDDLMIRGRKIKVFTCEECKQKIKL